MRKLTADEVEFEVTIEPEDIPVRGNASGWGEPEDTEYANEIIKRLDRGDLEAWCVVIVKATWSGYVGYDSLGACSFVHSGALLQNEIDATAHDHEMKDRALDDLNEVIAHDVARVKEIEHLLNPEGT
jgi:hypothetical protein